MTKLAIANYEISCTQLAIPNKIVLMIQWAPTAQITDTAILLENMTISGIVMVIWCQFTLHVNKLKHQSMIVMHITQLYPH